MVLRFEIIIIDKIIFEVTFVVKMVKCFCYCFYLRREAINSEGVFVVLRDLQDLYAVSFPMCHISAVD